MKISAILHKIRRENSQELQKKVASAFYEHSDIIIGPDYSLNENPAKISSYKHYNSLVVTYSSFSARHPDILIIPGTVLHQINEKEVVCEAPVFLNGKLERQLWKDSSNGEVELAAKFNLIYKRGDHGNKQFNFNGKKIAVEICGDHGRQDVRGCDLEIILAYDKKAGFWLNASNDNFARNVILCDGYKPKIEAWDYNPARQTRQIEIKGKQVGSAFIFDI